MVKMANWIAYIFSNEKILQINKCHTVKTERKHLCKFRESEAPSNFPY